MRHSSIRISLYLFSFLATIALASLTYTSTANPFPGTVYASFPETFETGTKTDYTHASIVLPSGSWDMDDALIGTSVDDKKTGSKSIRLQNTGRLTMLFNLPQGASQVSVQHAVYGTDATSTWGLWYSIDNGSSWVQVGSNVTTYTASLITTTFPVTVMGYTRFQLRKLGGGKLNIDNISISDTLTCGCGIVTLPTTATRDDNMALGNPSNATSATTDSGNFLVVKPQFALSYNNSKGMANWVSWHLSTAWKGSALRCDCFTQDATLPSGYFRASTSHYTSTGFDRGHICPSDDRDGSDEDNAATFKMTNISPQAPMMNQQTWGDLEDYCRTLITAGQELYIIAGGYGSGGTGSTGGITYSIESGKIKVPAHYWKIIVVLPIGTSDVSRISSATRVIAVDMPNVQTVISHPWEYYRTTTDAIEALTGYDFLSNVSTTIQATVEANVDTTPIP